MVRNAIKKLKNQLSEEEYFLGSDIEEMNGDWLSDTEPEGQLAVDVYQTEKDIVIKAPLAGVKESDIDITVQADQVLIKGERKEEREVEDTNYHHKECFWGSFSRHVALPVEGDPVKAKATFKNGILTLRIPKSNKAGTVRIKLGQ